MEVPPEEEEGEERECVARQQRLDRRAAPQPHEPPRGDRRGDRDLDRSEREVRLAVLDDTEREEQCGKAHARDGIGPGGAAGVVAHDVVVERGEVVHQERHEGRREDEGRRPGGPPQRGPGLADGARAPRCHEIDRDEGQDEERVQLRRAGDREREGRERAPLALEQEHGAEEWQEHEEVVAPLDDEREELRVEGDDRGEREALRGAADEERDQAERRDVRGQVEVALVPEDADVVEEPHEGHRDEEHEREVGQVVQGRVVDHRPVEHRRVQVVGDVWVHPVEELARRLLHHERAVVDVGVRASGLAQDERRDGRHDDERDDDRREMDRAIARRERASRAPVPERVGRRERAAGHEERDVRAEREELPERDVVRGGDRGVAAEEQQPVRDGDRAHDLGVNGQLAPRLERPPENAFDGPGEH